MSNWNSKEHFSRDAYLHMISQIASDAMLGKVVNGKNFVPLWFINGEIRVFWEDDVQASTANLVCDAILQRIREIGIFEGFDVVRCGGHESVMRHIITSTTTSGEINNEYLDKLCLSEVWRDQSQGGRQHADVIITTKPLIGDPVSWGVSDFNYGTMILALHSSRWQNETHLRNLVMHETNHLFGMMTHCDSFQNVEGYQYDTNCNMHYQCLNNPHLCVKCVDFIRQWWTQVQHELEQG